MSDAATTSETTPSETGRRADFEELRARAAAYGAATAERLLRDLRALDAPIHGTAATRLDHALQAATLAWRDGADEDWVASALLHDVGELYAPDEHDAYAAAVLEPFVRAQCAWTVRHHGAFQIADQDPQARDALQGHAYFDDGLQFCARWDRAALKPRTESAAEPLDFFEPIVARVFGRAPHDPSVTRPGARAPLFDSAVAKARGA